MAVISYHTSGAKDKDAFNNADANARVSYYGVLYLPTGIFDGYKWDVGGWSATYNEYRDSVNYEMTVNTPGVLSLKLTYNPVTRAGKIYTQFYSKDQIVEPSLHLRYAIIESHLHYHWQNQDSLQFIERDMFPSASGVLFTISQGQTFVDSQTFFINSAWVDYNCDLVVFVQSDVANYLKKVLISNEIPLYQRHVSGDANGDRTTTMSDLVFLINYVFYYGPQPYPSASGDPNENCVTDLGDVVYLIDYLFHGGPAPLRGWEID